MRLPVRCRCVGVMVSVGVCRSVECLGSVVWRTSCCPCSMPPPLLVTDGSKGTAGLLQFGTSDAAGVARTRSQATTNCLRDSNSGFSSRFTPEAFSMFGYGRKAAEVWNQGFPSPRGAPSQGNESPLPEATGFEAPVIRLCPFSCQ